ncbi:HDOD domain-containing protein [Desulfopila aestuarii]|uniref:HD-like signal output (HDOD) domain, no enzymatic activity n=1 Tax=Desulfopila aestuarii DSM 18488 TaxID=1121416 RepID=A0A1M7XZI8_9BACT|nr:HDOD domain-containing protein [Desulfopila aestuarii]SHO44643.1 HD-like signal output (HDOD) domain, no enzymatic activity [Desulfopila aestuarii DSM 18488]
MSAANELIAKFSAVQTLPHVVTKLSGLMADSNTTMKEFEDVIKMDPILVARLLKLVNSPFYGLLHKVDSIARAIAYLGMKNLHTIAVTQALKTIFTNQKDGAVFSRQKLWLHCAAVSICSKMVAERIFGINGDDAYLTGILHDFGIIVEDQVDSATFLEVCRDASSTTSMLEKEKKLFQTDHCEIGFILTHDWSMPVLIQEAIRDHHSQLDDVDPQSLTGILQIAEYLTAQQGYTTLPDVTTEISPVLIEHIQENIDEYTVLLEDFPEEMEKAKDLYEGEGN